jgi:hypothetical protein
MFCTSETGSCFVESDVMKAIDTLAGSNQEYHNLRTDFLAAVCSACPVSWESSTE